MSGFPMVATARQTYNGIALKTGDTFEATSKEEADDLVAVRMATRAKARLFQPPAPTVKTRDLSADAPTDDENKTPTATAHKDNTYNRRDMQARKR
jgi:hypothetical protein